MRLGTTTCGLGESMADLTLLIGDRATCAASLQAWLTMRCSELSFETARSPLDRGRTLAGGGVPRLATEPPILFVDEVPIWDSLAIGEFLAEHVPTLWPADARSRALARSIVCELHGGFADLQRFLPLDLLSRFGPPGRLLRAVERDLARITELWAACRARHAADGPFLFGRFSLADAMYAPIAARLAGHSVPMSPEVSGYVQTMMSLPAVLEWVEAAAAERGEMATTESAASLSSEPDSPREPGQHISDFRATSLAVPPGPASPHLSTVKPIGAGTRRRH